jgi:hypothetical protein
MEGGYDENGPERHVLCRLGHSYVISSYIMILSYILLHI